MYLERFVQFGERDVNSFLESAILPFPFSSWLSLDWMGISGQLSKTSFGVPQDLPLPFRRGRLLFLHHEQPMGRRHLQ